MTNDTYYIFCCPQMIPFKDLILNDPQFGKHFISGNIMWEKFADGFPNLFIENVSKIRAKDVVFLASFVESESIFSQFAVLTALPRYFVKSLTVALLYFPTGTMERVDEEGQIATAFTLARLFSTLPLTSTGPSKLIIYDIHSLQNRFYFLDNMIPVMLSAIPLLIQRLKQTHCNEKISIAFPDDGALKRFGKFFVDYPTVVFAKVRDGEKRILTIKDGKEFIEGHHVFMIDDLVQSGGTLLSCAQVLKSFTAEKVSCFVTHAVLPKDSWKKFTAPDSPITNFYITNSCPTMASLLQDKKPFTVLSLHDSLIHSILNE